MIDRLTCLGTCAYLGGLVAVPEPFCWSWSCMREFNTEFVCQAGETIHYTRSSFSLHASARNKLVQEMRGDWLFMTDTDHTFVPDTLYRLLTLMQRYQTPVLSGIYRHKALPHHPMLWMWHDAQGGFVPLVEVDKTAHLIKVDACGAGCLLVHRSVFERISRELEEPPFEHRGSYGEDFSFFVRCRELGIPVYATPHVEAVHLMLHGVTEEDYRPGWYAEEGDMDTIKV
jgi:hypothetical protein